MHGTPEHVKSAFQPKWINTPARCKVLEGFLLNILKYPSLSFLEIPSIFSFRKILPSKLDQCHVFASHPQRAFSSPSDQYCGPLHETDNSLDESNLYISCELCEFSFGLVRTRSHLAFFSNEQSGARGRHFQYKHWPRPNLMAGDFGAVNVFLPSSPE
ncbi:uncharacterized protein LOC128896788 [Hylaeus anthracinus]|uniref:uncharacterized protein LOC128896788 n=1 Tax=Hylaeus anthracinus TaxID=313031 RepID=UPI0023B91CC7|nr:uncharacterized protein LOC128896788 [Hylaeus anthracinus]